MQTCLNSLADSLEDNVAQCHGIGDYVAVEFGHRLDVFERCHQFIVTFQLNHCLDFLPCHCLQLTFLPHRELVLHHFGPGGDGELEVLPVLHDFRHTLDILPLLDELCFCHIYRSAEAQV